jgi:tRNA dimethylallyltransferase
VSKPIFIFVVGPTATGKTQLALRLAKKLKWPIINCDSLQVYKFVDIGTAKPTLEEKQGVPHFLFDYVAPPRTLTVADYVKDVVACIQTQKITHAVFVGGSGFYVQALEKGLYPHAKATEPVIEEVEDWIKREGFPALYRWIQQRDPAFSQKISENDHYRIQRAVQVMKSQSQTMTALKDQMASRSYSELPDHYKIKVGLNDTRECLRPRVKKRSVSMLERGLVAETQSLLDQGLAEWPPLKSVGYKETQFFLKNGGSEAQLIESIVTSTMQLIKKQQTWFQRNKDIQWFRPDQIQEASAWTLEHLQDLS